MITEEYAPRAAAEQRGRFVIHRGPAAAERRTSREAVSADQFRIWIAPQTSLFTALATCVIAHGFSHASMQLLAGELAEACLHTPGPDPAKERAAIYGPPIRLVGGARLLGGMAMLGHGTDGKPVLHCHAVLLDRRGRLLGGHLPPESCIVGAGGVAGWGIVPKDRGFVQRFDAETLFTIFFPSAAEEGNP